MEIIASSPLSKVLIQIDFTQLFAAHNTIEFTLSTHGVSTTVTQAMHGPCPYMAKLMGIFFSMDKMVGRKHEEGLANLQAISE